MTVQTDRLTWLDALRLDKGMHGDMARGACLLEAAAYVAGEPWSDHPACVSPILGAYGRALNDVLPDDKRQQLKPLVPRLIGTAGDGHDDARGLMAVDWLFRVYTPTWLRLAGLVEDAEQLGGLPRQVAMEQLEAAVPVMQRARKSADAARAAAWDAAVDAARVAARAAARAAARDAARVAAWDAAWDAARVAARAAAWDAAWDARDVLQPTVDQLQDSAITLYDRMIDPAVTS